MAIIPDPGVYAEQTALAQNAYDRALAAIKSKQAQTYQQYGMTADVGADGKYSNVRVDPNAKYGLVQMLKYQQGGQLDAAYNNAAQRHIGHRGLGAQGESALRFQQGAETQSLGSSFTSSLQDLFAQQQTALGDFNTAKYNAMQSAIRRALENQMFTPAEAPQEQAAAPEAPASAPYVTTPTVAQKALATYTAKTGVKAPKIGTMAAANIIKTARRGY